MCDNKVFSIVLEDNIHINFEPDKNKYIVLNDAARELFQNKDPIICSSNNQCKIIK
jgi:hypothetical protein